MMFSLFQAHLPFHSVFPYLRVMPPYAEQTPEEWCGERSAEIKLGDVVFVLDPIFSPWGNKSQGIGVSEGDKFRVAQVLLAIRQDAGYPMCVALSPDAFETQFLETILCVKADMARLAGHGFYYLLARPKKDPGPTELAQIAELHKYGNSGNRKDSPKKLPDPAYAFFSSLRIQLDPDFAKNPMDIELLAYYLFTDNDAAPAGHAPNLSGYFVPMRRTESAKSTATGAAASSGADAGSGASESASPAEKDDKEYGSQSLLALLSDDWTPDQGAKPGTATSPAAMSGTAAAAPGPPAPAKPTSSDSIRGMAAEIASLVEGLNNPEPEKSSKIQMAPSPGMKVTPQTPPPAPPPGQSPGVPLRPMLPSNHPLKKSELTQSGSNTATPAPAPQPAVPAPVPMYGAPLKENGSNQSPATDKKVTLEALLNVDEVPSAVAAGQQPLLFSETGAPSLADGLSELARSAFPSAASTASSAAHASPPESTSPPVTEPGSTLRPLPVDRSAPDGAPAVTTGGSPASSPPVKESQPEAVASPAAEPVASPAAEPVASPAAEPVASPAAEAVASPAVEPVSSTPSPTSSVQADPSFASSILQPSPYKNPFASDRTPPGNPFASTSSESPVTSTAAPEPASATPAPTTEPMAAAPPTEIVAAAPPTEIVATASTTGAVTAASTTEFKSSWLDSVPTPEPVAAAPTPEPPVAAPEPKTSWLDSAPTSIVGTDPSIWLQTTPTPAPSVDPSAWLRTTPEPGSVPAAPAPTPAQAPEPVTAAAPAAPVPEPVAPAPVPEPAPQAPSSVDPLALLSAVMAGSPVPAQAESTTEAATAPAPAALPEAAVAPTTAPAPAAVPETAAALAPDTVPETAAAPAPDTVPETAAAPAPDTVPETAAAPAPDTVPETATAPASAAVPEAATAPMPAALPEAAATPAPAEVPEVATAPAPAVLPEAAATPAPAEVPEVATAPVPAALPEAATAPAAVPEAATAPVQAALPEAATAPAAVPEAATAPAPAAVPEAAIAPAPVAVPEVASSPAAPAPQPAVTPPAILTAAATAAPTPPAPAPSSIGSALGREPAPAGVTGLIAKLEQQAQRATGRLEQKLGEIQARLHQDLEGKVTVLTAKDQLSLKNVGALRAVLSRRLSATGDELKEQLKVMSESGCESIKESSSSAASSINDMGGMLSQEVLTEFDQLDSSTLGLAAAYGEKAEAEQQQRLAEMSEVLKVLQSKLENTSRQHFNVMQGHHDLLERRLKELSELSVTELNSTFERLVAELLLHKEDCINRLNALSDELTDTIQESMALCGLNIHMHAEQIATSGFIPRLMQFKQAFTASVQKLREQYKEEVEKAATMKLAELRPLLLSNREKIESVVANANTLKSNVEIGQKEAFEKMLVSLTEFVEGKLAEAKKLAESSTQEFSNIDQNVYALSDAASIESDPELAAARAKVLARLQDIGTQLQDGVNETLSKQVAGMEDKSRMLQEELISSMEGDAYGVRKSLETSVSRIKQALEQAYNRIHALQNHYLQ